jgi:hypothetical protein
MSIRQTLQSAQGTVTWSRREGNVTYFLRKSLNRYEVWTSLDSGSKSPVTLDQAVTYYSQHNLVNANAAARPEPTAPTRPAPAPPPPAPRPSTDQRLQSIRSGGQINVNADLTIVYVRGQYLAYNPRNANLSQIRLNPDREIANGNASPLSLAQARTAITTGARNTTSAPTTTRTPAPAARPATTPARTTNPSNTRTPAPVTRTTRTPAPVPSPPTPTPPTPTPAPQPRVNELDDIQLAVTVSDVPITIVTEPVTVDIPTFDRRGRVTGTEQVALELPPVTIDPNELSTVNVLSDDQLAAISPDVLANLDAEIAASLPTNEELLARIPAFESRADWRVRLALSDALGVNYLYKAPNPGILNPLNATNGVIFPYTPTISVNYAANYNPTELVHNNYKVFQYSSSSVDSISISCDFTAQDEYEANYLLAVIHFFRSATKMFYGQDQNPRRGTPPPLCYIYGMGSYQFAGQPLAISQFSYNLPNNVDYIQTSTGTGGTAPVTTDPSRMAGTGVAKGGVLPPPQFAPIAEPGTVSWVPSKIQLQITCVPMMNRNAVSNEFSLEKYATGSLLNGIGTQTGGFW